MGFNKQGQFGGGLIFHQKSGECHDIRRKQIKMNFLKINALIDIIFLQLSRAKPGNPASIYIYIYMLVLTTYEFRTFPYNFLERFLFVTTLLYFLPCIRSHLYSLSHLQQRKSIYLLDIHNIYKHTSATVNFCTQNTKWVQRGSNLALC